MRKLLIDGKRSGYAPEQCGSTMTVGMLMEALEEGVKWGPLERNMPIYLCNDNGYTYGEISSWSSFFIGVDADDPGLERWEPEVWPDDEEED